MKWIKIKVETEYERIKLTRVGGDTFISTSKQLNEELGDFLHTPDEEPLSDGQDWVSVEKDMPPDCTVVLGYSPAWVDEDFEPEGIRECFYSESMEEWNSAKWDNDQDHWWNDTDTKPTHWMRRPTPPNIKNKNSK